MIGKRVLLLLATGALALLVAEAAAIVCAGRSLLGLALPAPGTGQPAPAPRSRAPTDDDLIAAAARNPGLLRVHPDPLVGFVLRAKAELTILEAPLHTDGLGLRVRPGPKARPDAFRIVVLGDSVAFGFGVRDDEVLGHRLETLLNQVRPAGSRQVVVTTVAVPGWNHRNAVAFLMDHASFLPADVVLLMPIGNDLADTSGVLDTGHRRVAPDIAAQDPWLAVAFEANQGLMLGAHQRALAAGQAFDPTGLGPSVIVADLSPESSRRYDENVASIATLADHCRRTGARLMLLQYAEEDYVWHLWTRLRRVGLELPVVPLFDDALPAELGLVDDAHPNAESHAAMATWCAAALLEAGWIPDTEQAAALPEVGALHLAERAPVRAPEEWSELSARARERARGQLLSAIEVASGRGVLQVYGGLNPDGSAQRVLRLLLAPAGAGASSLELELSPLERPDAAPITVRVEADGHPLGELTLVTGQPLRERLALPPREPPEAPIEVCLRASRAVVGLSDGRTQMESYRLVRVACVDG